MTVDLSALTAAWSHLARVSHAATAPITDDAELAEATDLLELVLAEIGDTQQHPLGGLAHTLIERVTAYEEQRYPITDVDAAGMLAFLMDQRRLTQRQLAEATGINQATISQVLNRKRDLTTDQIRALAAHFKVQPALFL